MEDAWQHEMLAYSDDAVVHIAEVPDYLKDSQVIRTAKEDTAYWANDYIVATAGEDLELYVAHDPKVPLPQWLKDYEKTGDKVKLNRGVLDLYKTRLAKDEGLQISGNADQGKSKKRSFNIILFCKPAAEK